MMKIYVQTHIMEDRFMENLNNAFTEINMGVNRYSEVALGNCIH